MQPQIGLLAQLIDDRLRLLALVGCLGLHGAHHGLKLELAPLGRGQRLAGAGGVDLRLAAHPDPLAVVDAASVIDGAARRVGLSNAFARGANLRVGEDQLSLQVVDGVVSAAAHISCHQTVLQDEHRKALLAQHQGRGNTALPGVAAQHIGYLRVELPATCADLREGYVEAAGKTVMSVLVGEAHVQPPGASPDQLLCLLPA